MQRVRFLGDMLDASPCPRESRYPSLQHPNYLVGPSLWDQCRIRLVLCIALCGLEKSLSITASLGELCNFGVAAFLRRYLKLICPDHIRPFSNMNYRLTCSDLPFYNMESFDF